MRNRKNQHRSLLGDDPLWYKDAVIYELHVRAFFDSNEDGIGDLPGLYRKMDYLQDLGVTALWLLPFYPSPLRDDGYDISDYTDINPIYGTLTDFKAVMRAAHQRGLRVITELVINHTSDRHPWFQRARAAPPGSAWRDYYVWSDNADKYKEARIIFKDFEPSNWTWDAVAKAFYWHRFYAHQPDLNFDHPAVHRAVLDVLDFWLNLGIDGLRLDAIPYLYEREGTSCDNLPETHAFIKKLRRHVDDHFRNRMLLAEANQWPEDAVSYFGAGDECHMAFHFPLMPRLFMAIHTEDRFPIIDILQQTPGIPEANQWALFLRNHDELTLEMVTREDRDYMYRVYAQDASARINLGIRRRLAPLLENHRGKIELMNGLLFSLPGTPVIYYGDEIGMGDNIFLGDRNGVRTPMQWTSGRNAGFSEANPQRLFLPVNIDPEYHYQTLNVEAQQNNRHSLLWWMKRLIALRKRYRAFGRGSLEFLTPDNAKVLVFLRRYRDERILVVANLSRYAQCVEIDLGAFQGAAPVEMFGRSAFAAIGDRPYQLTLGPFAFYWLLLAPAPAARAAPSEPALARLEVGGRWESVFAAPALESLEKLLPDYLLTQNWFTGRGGEPAAARIVDRIAIPQAGGASAFVGLVQVEYRDGEPRTFVLPFAFRRDEASNGESSGAEAPAASLRICRLLVKGDAGQEDHTGFLYDPLADQLFAQSLLDALARHRRFRTENGELLARTLASNHPLRGTAQVRADSTLVKAEQSNTSVIFGDRFLLKVFRHVEPGIHSEVELGQALMEKTEFAQAAPVLGALEYRADKAEPMTLATLLGYMPNEGDAWRYTLEAVRRYLEQVLTKRDSHPKPVLPQTPFLDLVREELPALAREAIGAYLESARLMGRRSAEMHLALASIDDDAFRPEPFSVHDQRSTYQTIRTWVLRVFQQLRQQLSELPEAARADAQIVLGRAADFIQHLRAILSRPLSGQRIRCHGDYRLGSLLHTGKDFVVIDFEGETLRPLSSRRHKRSPIRDVAGWIYSMYTAVETVLDSEQMRPEDKPAAEPWARYWRLWTAVAFVKAYLDAVGDAPFMPRFREEIQIVLDYCLFGRALYELRYSLLNRPDRARIPLRAMLYLLLERDRRQAMEAAPGNETTESLPTGASG